MTYQQKLSETKEHYPFARWQQSYDDGLHQYTPENCNKAEAIFDTLISELVSTGENAAEDKKVELFKMAVLELNQLHDEVIGFIETGEREELCELIDQITLAAGLDPANYADGDGIADEWRTW
jgi:hypothetical protein